MPSLNPQYRHMLKVLSYSFLLSQTCSCRSCSRCNLFVFDVSVLSFWLKVFPHVLATGLLFLSISHLVLGKILSSTYSLSKCDIRSPRCLHCFLHSSSHWLSPSPSQVQTRIFSGPLNCLRRCKGDEVIRSVSPVAQVRIKHLPDSHRSNFLATLCTQSLHGGTATPGRYESERDEVFD